MASYGPSNTFAAGRFNVWIPNRSQSAFVSFDTAAEALADVQSHGMGVVLNPAGQLDPTLQGWNGWSAYQTNFQAAPVVLNPSAGATVASQGNAAGINTNAMPPTPTTTHSGGSFGVWIPANQLGTAGLASSNYPNGAFYSYASLAEAQAHVQRTHAGAVLDTNGSIAPGQTLQPQTIAQLDNVRLQAAATPGKYNLWFPQSMVTQLIIGNPAAYPNGAFLSFDSLQEAQQHFQNRGMGVFLEPTGSPSASQPWGYAKQFVIELSNANVKPTIVAGKYNVWFPQQYIGSIGLKDTTGYTTGGYLSFDSLQEAQAHVTLRAWGVLLDPQGMPEAQQTWGSASQFVNQYIVQLANAKLTATPAANMYNVWFPQQLLSNVGVAAGTTFTNGAYLSFKTIQEAQDHIKARSFGLVLEPNGAPSTTQPWNGSTPYLIEWANANVKTDFVAGKYNVWFPQQHIGSVGLKNIAGYTNGGFLAFDSLQDAQAHVSVRRWGVVLDPQGKPEAQQVWNAGGPVLAQLENNRLLPNPVVGEYNVWFPPSVVSNLYAANQAAYSSTGAYLSFGREQDAVDHAKTRGFGVVLDPSGNMGSTQPWSSATQFVAQRFNAKLVARPVAGKFNVWFPQPALPQVGVVATGPFNVGAFLPFDTLQEAQDHVKLRGSVGAILNTQGTLDPAHQTWGTYTAFANQLSNLNLTAQPTSGKYNVWFPPAAFAYIGLGNAGFPNGAYLPFDSAADAQAHVRSRGSVGVILDTQGGLDPAQIWPSANTYGTQLYNAKLEKTRPDGMFSVWFPQSILTSIGIGDISPFPQGAYLRFNTLQEAQDHAKLRNMGVVYDPAGKYDPQAQVWGGVSAYAPAVWPPPPPVNDQAPIGTADIIGMYGEATPTGAKIVVRTHNQQMNETLSYELFVVINGSDMKVLDLGKRSMTPGSYVLDAPFDIDYAQLTNIVSAVQPGVAVSRGTPLAVRVRWPSGHDQGAANAGGRGAHRMPAP